MQPHRHTPLEYNSYGSSLYPQSNIQSTQSRTQNQGLLGEFRVPVKEHERLSADWDVSLHLASLEKQRQRLLAEREALCRQDVAERMAASRLLSPRNVPYQPTLSSTTMTPREYGLPTGQCGSSAKYTAPSSIFPQTAPVFPTTVPSIPQIAPRADCVPPPNSGTPGLNSLSENEQPASTKQIGRGHVRSSPERSDSESPSSSDGDHTNTLARCREYMLRLKVYTERLHSGIMPDKDPDRVLRRHEIKHLRTHGFSRPYNELNSVAWDAYLKANCLPPSSYPPRAPTVGRQHSQQAYQEALPQQRQQQQTSHQRPLPHQQGRKHQYQNIPRAASQRTTVTNRLDQHAYSGRGGLASSVYAPSQTIADRRTLSHTATAPAYEIRPTVDTGSNTNRLPDQHHVHQQQQRHARFRSRGSRIQKRGRTSGIVRHTETREGTDNAGGATHHQFQESRVPHEQRGDNLPSSSHLGRNYSSDHVFKRP